MFCDTRDFDGRPGQLMTVVSDGRAAVVVSVGGFVPGLPVTNEQLEDRFDTTDAWIRQRTGIRSRHFAAPGTATSDLAIRAGRRALDAAGNPRIDMLILATTTPDHPCPATAPAVAAALELGPIAAFDVAAVCTGFVYALALASSVVESAMAQCVLVIGADTFSGILDPTDRTTSVIFGDGAGAMVVRAGHTSEPGAVLATHLASDGSAAQLITVPGGGARQRSDPNHEWNRYFTMQGKAVFDAAVRAMSDSTSRVLQELNWDPKSVDRLVAHQANLRILRSVTIALGVDPERALVHVDRVGNTSAASVPLALADSVHQLAVGERVILTAFGGGTTWGSVALTWPEVDKSAHTSGVHDDALVP